MWLGLTVQLRCLSAALVTAWVSWQKEPKVTLAPWGDGARSHPPPRWGTEGAFRLSSCVPTPSLSQPLSWDSINPQEQRRWISALTDKGNLLEKQTPRPELHTWLTNLGSYLHSQNKWSRPEYKCSCNLLPWLNEIGSSPIQTEGFFPIWKRHLGSRWGWGLGKHSVVQWDTHGALLCLLPALVGLDTLQFGDWSHPASLAEPSSHLCHLPWQGWWETCTHFHLSGIKRLVWSMQSLETAF